MVTQESPSSLLDWHMEDSHATPLLIDWMLKMEETFLVDFSSGVPQLHQVLPKFNMRWMTFILGWITFLSKRRSILLHWTTSQLHCVTHELQPSDAQFCPGVATPGRFDIQGVRVAVEQHSHQDPFLC